MCTCEVYTWTEDQQASARRRATAGGDIHGLGTASRVGLARMVTDDTGGTGPVFQCSPSCRCASVRFASHRGCVIDHGDLCMCEYTYNIYIYMFVFCVSSCPCTLLPNVDLKMLENTV